MNSILIFNHHSLPFDSKEKAVSAVPEFLKICHKINILGISTVLLGEQVDKKWFRVKLANDYYWQDWYHQHNNDQYKDLIRAFRSIETRQPFFSEEDIGEGLNLFEVKLNGDDKFSALRASVWHESSIASFATRAPWNTSPIQVEVNEIKNNEEIVSNQCDIINFHSLGVLQHHEEEFIKKRNASIISGKEITERKNELFPFLEFCGKAPEQLNYWTGSITILEQVKDSFTALNRFGEKWNSGEITCYTHESLKNCGLHHDVSGESQSVVQNQALRKEREFWLPSGRKKLFENHIKIARGYRIHFYPDSINKKLYVGYIGSHLRLL